MNTRVAVILHGAGSNSAFALSAFTPSDLAVDIVIAPDHRGGIADAISALTRGLEEAQDSGFLVTIVGGVSLGAHAAAAWASSESQQNSLRGLLLAMPAWTGAPGSLGEATVGAGLEVARVGSAREVARLRQQSPDDWVVAAVAESWPTYGDEALSASLIAAGRSPAPSTSDLERITCPTVVLALQDDPLHPASVAAVWAAQLPHARLVELARDLDGRGPREIGRVAGLALTELSESR